MKILLISDTHNATSTLEKEILPKYAHQVQLAIHLGDYIRDLLKFQVDYPALTMVGVGGSFEYNEQNEKILTLGDTGKRALLTHGHSIGVKSDLTRITYYAKEKGVDACFFGHTHQLTIFSKDGIFFMNPGSITFPRSSDKGSFGLVTISDRGNFSEDVIFI
jgi:putative phosphoesterase